MKTEAVSGNVVDELNSGDSSLNQCVPADKTVRDFVRDAARNYSLEHKLVPPLSIEELRQHTSSILSETEIDPCFESLTMVLLSNAIWESVIASVPYERRVLLIPQCLRSLKHCRAEIDEFGLVCDECGSCMIGDLQALAEELGYVVLVAEGTTLVTKLLEGGKVDAVVGVSCLSVLERTFPYMSSEAIPGIAIPLLRDGCKDTSVDEDWIRKAIELKSDKKWTGHVDITSLRAEVAGWFEREMLFNLSGRNEMGDDSASTEKIAFAWLSKSGKRWRPFLASAVFQAIADIDGAMPQRIKKLAMAVECFHKASLIHDDIEDDDSIRYGEATLHEEYGIPIALNVGDYLLGEGYRLISVCGSEPERVVRMLKSASAGHKTLCMGQGEELFWGRSSFPPSSETVIEIFRCKTSPAFAVALSLGAICAGADSAICNTLDQFSESLGIAYQIKDDIEDYNKPDLSFDRVRPSLLLALALENATPDQRELIATEWQYREKSQTTMKVIAEIDVQERAKQLLEYYKRQAIRSLSNLTNAPLKTLLRRVIGRVLGKLE